MLIGVPAETAVGETRVAVTPETVKKLKAQGHDIGVQAGAGLAASVTDEAFVAAGATITDAAGALGAELVLKVRPPAAAELALMKPGASLVGMLNPFDAEGLQQLAPKRLAVAIACRPATPTPKITTRAAFTVPAAVINMGKNRWYSLAAKITAL